MDKKPEAIGVRLGTKRRMRFTCSLQYHCLLCLGGCNGLSYTLNYVTELDKKEDRVEQNGITVMIDPRALMHLVGTTMDFYEDDLVAEFRFENPNADSYCGCGESFNSKAT